MAAILYTLLLFLHNIVRWAVLAAAVWALYRAYNGWFGRREWNAQDGQANRVFANVVTLQFVLGVVLYVWPQGYVMSLLRGLGGTAMRQAEPRFFVAEHTVAMVIALALVHIGAARARKAPTSAAKFRRAAIFFTIALLVILVSIPWPFNHGRPLYRLPF